MGLRSEINQLHENLRLSEAAKLEAEVKVHSLQDQINAKKQEGER